jgi:hypothetical protein
MLSLRLVGSMRIRDGGEEKVCTASGDSTSALVYFYTPFFCIKHNDILQPNGNRSHSLDLSLMHTLEGLELNLCQ